MAAKDFSLSYAPSKTVYAVIRRESDGYFLNDADGSFVASPADPYLSLTEDGAYGGLYEVSESRTAWTDGVYMVLYYEQAAGAPAPATDSCIGGPVFFLVADDAELTLLGNYDELTSSTYGLSVIHALLASSPSSAVDIGTILSKVSSVQDSSSKIFGAIRNIDRTIQRIQGFGGNTRQVSQVTRGG